MLDKCKVSQKQILNNLLGHYLIQVQMSNPFSFQQQPCLDFLHDDTPQSNSLLANIVLKEQMSQDMHYPYHDGQNEHQQAHVQMGSRNQGKQRVSRPKTKQKKKVFYRDKMAQLINEQNYVMPDYNYVDFAQFQKGKSPISRDEQLKRNRQSAKQSRQRKKQYMQTLEQRNKINQKQIDELTLRLRQTQLQRDRLRQSNNADVQSFNQLKAECYDKLSQVLESISQNRDQQIDQCISNLRQSFGSAGKQRISLMNYYMCEIIQNLLTDFQKYFINCAITEVGIFMDINEEKGPTKIDAQIADILGINRLRKNSLAIKFKHRFKKEATLFNEKCQQLYQSFSSLISQCSILENIFNDLKKEFQPDQVARLILYFQENKFRKDLRKMRNQWYQNFSKDQNQIVDSIRKLTKRKLIAKNPIIKRMLKTFISKLLKEWYSKRGKKAKKQIKIKNLEQKQIK